MDITELDELNGKTGSTGSCTLPDPPVEKRLPELPPIGGTTRTNPDAHLGASEMTEEEWERRWMDMADGMRDYYGFPLYGSSGRRLDV